MQLSKGEETALKVLKSGANTFITGGAGVGKSSVLMLYIDWLRDSGKDAVVLAPTGIAAGNVCGVTLHTFFEIPIGVILKSDLDAIKKYDSEVDNTLLYVDTVIIDEISMCRIDTFDFVAIVINKANARRKLNGLKPIQLVVSGDFFQLPPVITEQARHVLEREYKQDIGLGFAFQSPLWNNFKFINVVLTEVIRQQDRETAQMLNEIRTGNSGWIESIKTRCSKTATNGIILCGRNSEASSINRDKLAELPGVAYEFKAQYTGEAKDTDTIAEDSLLLKHGARVIILTNDTEKWNYVNGSLGYVTEMYQDAIVVTLDNGESVVIQKFTWEVYNYYLVEDEGTHRNKIEKQCIGTVEQFPIKLAYAITIHKSQGMTYQSVNINPRCWECGQLYVALSRVTSLENMYFIHEPSWRDIAASSSVIKFYNSLAHNFTLESIEKDIDNKDEAVGDNFTDLMKVINNL